MMTVHEIVERTRASGQRLGAAEAGVLFAAIVRLAAAQGATLRSRLVQLDAQGGLHLLPFDDQLAEAQMGYLAPELLAADAPRKSEPRVQVYAAGALGYELLTGRDPRDGLDAELPSPLGDIVRMALAPDRRERFGDLTQLFDAVESAQPRMAPEPERQLLAALHARAAPAAGKEALAKLIAQVGEVQKQVAKISGGQRELAERLDRFEEGQRLLPARAGGGSPVLVPLLAGLAGAAAVLVGAWALGFAVQRPEQAGGAGTSGSASPTVSPAAAPSVEPSPRAGEGGAAAGPAATAATAPAPAAPAPSAARADHPSAPAGAPAAAAPGRDAAPARGSPAAAAPPNPAGGDSAGGANSAKRIDAAGGARPPAGGTEPPTAVPAAPPTAQTAAADPPDNAAQAGAPPAGAAPAPSRSADKPRAARPAEVSPAMLAHAVAQAQVKRGEAAIEQSRLDEAIASFHTAIENEPSNASAYRGLGTAYSMQSNEAMAVQSYEQYLRLAPSARDAGEIRRAIDGLKVRARIGGAEEK